MHFALGNCITWLGYVIFGDDPGVEKNSLGSSTLAMDGPDVDADANFR